jgi:hypothetical protein
VLKIVLLRPDNDTIFTSTSESRGYLTKKETKGKPQLRNLVKEKPKQNKKSKIHKKGLDEKVQKNSADRNLLLFSPLDLTREFKCKKKKQLSAFRNDRILPNIKEEKKFGDMNHIRAKEENKHKARYSVFQDDWESKYHSNPDSKDAIISEFELHNC